MDDARFDAALRMMTSRQDRRTTVGAFLGLALGSGATATSAKKGGGKKGGKKRGKKHPPRAHAPSCVPDPCPTNTCGTFPDDCVGTIQCGCAANQLCHQGVCRGCTVNCANGDPGICGDYLQLALSDGGTVYVCPGLYRGFFTLDAAVTVIGAGQGAGVVASTILDGRNDPSLPAPVVYIPAGTGTVRLEQLRVTRGNSLTDGVGIRHEGDELLMRDCTVAGNAMRVIPEGGELRGGGIYSTGRLLLERCTLRGNGATDGGGLYAAGQASLTDCVVTANEATSAGGGIAAAGAGRVQLGAGSRVCGNTAPTDPQCSGFTSAACQTTCPA
jgi:hypothetical protein